MKRVIEIMKSKKFFIANAILGVFILGLVIGAFFLPNGKVEDGKLVNQVYAQDSANVREGLKALENMQYSFRAVAEEVLPVVVEIDVVEVIKQKTSDSFSPFDFFNNPEQNPFRLWPNPDNKDNDNEEREFRRPGLGSGVIVDKKGNKVYVITNNHVVGNADEIVVKLNDDREYKAKIVGKDPRIDLALVSFETSEFIPVARLGNSSDVWVGDWVLAIGTPMGFESSVTAGIVSALGRQAERGSNIADFTDYIQTDAAINPGNSGGALTNIKGEIIGINTWIASQSGGSVGLGFAIPIDTVKKAINDFITQGKILYGWLGVSISDPNPDYMPGIAESLKIEDMDGSLIMHLFKGSPAEKSGLRAGDYIVKVDDTDIKNTNQLTRIIGNRPPGTQLNVNIIREGKEMSLKVTLEARREEEAINADRNVWPGLAVQPISDEVRKELKIKDTVNGLLIFDVEKDSPADTAGFKQGDVITTINNKSGNSVMDFYKALGITKGEVTFRVNRNGTEIILGLIR
ncbi:MAG: Do family serine endopeptidase [Spirochaetales bacterium]|nr:Do family serine endopeptidase [Spirochaetales bacterium]